MTTKSKRAQQFLAKKIIRQKDAAQSARTVHAHLSECFEENTYQTLPQDLVTKAKVAKSDGPFPSAAMLMLMFEDLL